MGASLSLGLRVVGEGRRRREESHYKQQQQQQLQLWPTSNPTKRKESKRKTRRKSI
jgi:hypothetical protein